VTGRLSHLYLPGYQAARPTGGVGQRLVHPFCRIGRLAMMRGGSAIPKNLPSFCVTRGNPSCRRIADAAPRRRSR